MPNLSAAKKSLRQSKKRRLLNLRYKKGIKEALKGGNLPLIYKALDKAVKKNIISPNKAARTKAQASRSARSLSANQDPKAADK